VRCMQKIDGDYYPEVGLNNEMIKYIMFETILITSISQNDADTASNVYRKCWTWFQADMEHCEGAS